MDCKLNRVQRNQQNIDLRNIALSLYGLNRAKHWW